MSRFSRFGLAVVVLIFAATPFAAAGFAVPGDKLRNSLFFATWLLVLVTLFALAVRLPLRGRGSRFSAFAANALIVTGAIAVTIAANVALYRHDVHFDATREGQNTPPRQLTDV